MPGLAAEDIPDKLIFGLGEVAEWFKALAWKASVR